MKRITPEEIDESLERSERAVWLMFYLGIGLVLFVCGCSAVVIFRILAYFGV